jgi:hypothetical protein
MIEKQNYTVQQFVEAFNVSKSALYRMWQRQEGPSTMQVGRRKLIPVDAAVSWVNHQIARGRTR